MERVYTHAGVGLHHIKNIADVLNVPFNRENPQALAKTIDLINETFSRSYVYPNKVSNLLENQQTPFFVFIWNKLYAKLDCPPEYVFVHGHDYLRSNYPRNVFNLDNSLGKSPALHKSIYLILYSKQKLIEPSLESVLTKVRQELEKLVLINSTTQTISAQPKEALQFSPQPLITPQVLRENIVDRVLRDYGLGF